MSTFLVTVRTVTWSFSYTQIAKHHGECINSAIDNFGVIGVSVKPIKDKK